MSRPSPSEDLERVQVLDLTRVRAGPTGVCQLVDWGANAIKVEIREPGDGKSGEGADVAARHDPISKTCTATSGSGSI